MQIQFREKERSIVTHWVSKVDFSAWCSSALLFTKHAHFQELNKIKKRGDNFVSSSKVSNSSQDKGKEPRKWKKKSTTISIWKYFTHIFSHKNIFSSNFPKGSNSYGSIKPIKKSW